MALFEAFMKREEQSEPAKPVDKHVTEAEMKSMLKDAGIDVDEIEARREEERRAREAQARMREADRSQRMEDLRLDRETAAELVQGGHLVVKLDGAFQDTAVVKCKCDHVLEEPAEFIQLAARLWREDRSPDKKDLISDHILESPVWGSKCIPCYNETVKCSCGTVHRCFVQLVL